MDLHEEKWRDAVTEGGPLHNEDGTLCRVVEFPPETSSPFHRTISLDYGKSSSASTWNGESLFVFRNPMRGRNVVRAG